MSRKPEYAEMLIMGNGTAAYTAIWTLRRRGFSGGITVVSNEEYPAHARMLTPYYVSGKLDRENTYFAGMDFYRRSDVKAILGSGAAAVEADRRIVFLEDGSEIAYRRLLVATGSRPYMPDIPGIDSAGVLGLRSLTDAGAMIELVAPGDHAVVLGGGLVSVMSSRALAKKGMKVTMVVTSPRILSQQLTGEAAGLVEPELVREGLVLLKGRDAAEIIADRHGRVKSIRLDNGEEIPCRLLVVGKGVRPCLDMMAGTGLKTDPGLPVNSFMETGIPEIYGAGDITVAPDLLDGRPQVVATQTNAVQQGRTAALNMMGLRFKDEGSLPLNTAHYGNVRMVSCGRTGRLMPREREEVITAEGVYRRFVFREDRLIGITLAGNVSGAGWMISMIRRKAPVNGKLGSILSGIPHRFALR